MRCMGGGPCGVAFQRKARSRFASPGLFCFFPSAKQACVGLKTKKPGCIATELFFVGADERTRTFTR